jgi:hypothetical protein
MRSFFYRGRFIFIPLAGAAFLSLVSFVVMSLWNYLMPVIFHLGVITFWQAMGIFVLCKILFGFGKGGHRGGGAPWMKHRMAERFKNMTPEEREKFKEKWGQKCGHGRWGEGHNWDNYTADTTKATE